METSLRVHLPDRADTLVERLDVAELINSWQQDFGIDVARLFDGITHLDMRENTQSGQIYFDPPIIGDAAFYQALRKFDWYHPPTKEEFHAAAKWCASGGEVSDIGAGAAGFAAHVPAGRYLGLETDGEAVEAARARGIPVLNMDMAAYRAAPGFRAAQLVTAFQVLEHVPEPKAFLDDMVSLAQEGGYLAIGLPDAASYVANLPDFMLNAPPHHLSWWTEESLGALMRASGLKIVSVNRFPVERWERQLWWMAKLANLANLARGKDQRRFGRQLRVRKILSYAGAWGLQGLPIRATARGSTLLMIGQKPG